MNDTVRGVIICLAKEGFHASTIAKAVTKHTGARVSKSSVYQCLAYNGISLRDYRNGKTPLAKTRISQASPRMKRRRAG